MALDKDSEYKPFQNFGNLGAKIFGSPFRYIQKPGLIEEIGIFLKFIKGTKVGILSTDNRFNDYYDVISKSLKNESNIETIKIFFEKKCTTKFVNKKVEELKNEKLDYLIALGGGSCLDAGRVIADRLRIPIVNVPTLASTDAPTASLSVLYTEEGDFNNYEFFPTSPSAVLVDSKIIADAGPKFLAAGMGDALSTYYEAAACSKSNHSRNSLAGKPTLASLAITEMCKNTLYEYGYQAYSDLKNKLGATDAVEKIIEANTLHSGLGFESGGLAACHSVHNGLTCIETTKSFNHGQKVAFGVMVQLMLENDVEEAKKAAKFLKSINLPTKLSDINIKNDDLKSIKAIANKACSEQESIHNMPFKVTTDMVIDAIKKVNELTID